MIQKCTEGARECQLFPHDLDDHTLSAPSVEFGIVDLLPRTEIQLSGGDRNDNFMMDQQALQVRVPVGFPRPVMTVVRVERGEAFEPVIDILNQPALGVVDIDSGSDVHR